MNIYIIGFMATGKSSVGQALARWVDREFVDLDAYVEKNAGKRIADIFAQAGESFFRQLERAALAEVAARDNLVVSCGGGIVIDSENIHVMKRTGKVICLKASVETIEKRSAVSDDRPLLNVSEKRERIEKLLVARAALYAKAADLTIDTTTRTIDQVTRIAAEFLSAEVQ